MAKLRFNKFGLVDDPRGGHCTYTYHGQEILGEVVGVERSESRGFTFLKVRYLNGEPWPFDPIAANVNMLERTYETAN